MKRKWITTGLAAFCAVITLLLSLGNADDERIFIVQDALDPLIGLIEPYAQNSIELLTPYQLGQRLPGLNGMVFVFGTQARPYREQSASLNYVPLYSATVVIAVNQNSNLGDAVRGWQTLFEGDAVVLLPHNGTEGGRLTAIAIAKALGAADGDLTPAINAFAKLQSQGRLGGRDVYTSADYEYMYSPDYLAEFDAIALWDYQAAVLTKISDDWNIIVPEEGAFSVDCGFVCGESSNAQKELRSVKEFLLSQQGEQELIKAGFSPLAREVDLSAWDMARLTYNPMFRRTVLSQKLYGPASVQERLLLQCTIMLLFCIAMHWILRRIPRGIYRATSFCGMLFMLLWMLISIIKALSMHYDLTRYCWFATYLPRHILPICWLCMCYMNRYKRLPSRKSLIVLSFVAVILTVLVFTNDVHRFIFVYSSDHPASWTDQYTNGWGYYLSLLWSFSLIIFGLVLLFHKNKTRQQTRQMLYAGVLFCALLLYQALYIVGAKHMLDLDISTTVAICILAFNIAAQRERFMGASLLELPIFQNSSYAIAIYDSAETIVFSNMAMNSLRHKEETILNLEQASGEFIEVSFGKQVYKPCEFMLDAGRALILEDITALRRLERLLKETHQKLKAVQELLMRQVEETPYITSRLEQERYSLQMDKLFNEKLEELRLCLRQISQSDIKGEGTQTLLRRARFMLYICQQRLRLVIRSMEEYPFLPAKLIENYAAGVIRDGQRVGLDGVVTAVSRGNCSFDIAALLLEAIDCICLYAFDLPGSSFICRFEAYEDSVLLSTMISWESDPPYLQDAILRDQHVKAIGLQGGHILREMGDDGLLFRLSFPQGVTSG